MAESWIRYPYPPHHQTGTTLDKSQLTHLRKNAEKYVTLWDVTNFPEVGILKLYLS
jgi:hypothetical protein